MTQKMNMAVGLSFDFLKTPLGALYEKTDTSSKILVVPTQVSAPQSVTLGEMAQEFSAAFKLDLNPEEITNKLKIGNTDLGELKFMLQAAFLYKEMPSAPTTVQTPASGQTPETTQAPATTQTPASGQTPVSTQPANAEGVNEYAFSIAVDASNALPDIGFLKINKLSLSVWNTERQGVLNQMGVGTILQMLQQLG